MTATAAQPLVLPGDDGTHATMRLLVACPDKPGIVAAVSRFLFDAGANILRSDQYSSDPTGGAFFLRMEFTLRHDQRADFAERFGHAVAERFDIAWRLWDADRPKRIAVLVSRYDHCLLDLLYRWKRGDLGGEIALVASNHADLRTPVEAAGVPYHHVPVARDDKPAAEARLLELLGAADLDMVVLARYMQILSGTFLERLGVPVINIHHSFLPAFAGAGPYERAKARGVKLIGATAHYVTEELDEGPIIEQDVIRVTHRDSAAELTRLGADIERVVFSRAVQWHCEDRVLVHGSTTVVF
ncbi:formyltetrahydrofolate deformylase [Conexibacter woesei]|uniref:Formyltetrahydrofolate deformylase n=1 Tax=Conexibacter woesei (strain DSM 14684 / CCUG 47730 / CIP 108061 / JCM 11494 / NBRC 100937 / ID131577) TaxID=469383 RepID=D3F6W8_CONWI|nr:formyltetrahydrofolate deformylase [Conexibacter woesei]ADB52766.1 formyltetrahydrofolate deformylase [Conexibacter woesei DSM 14684]